MTDSSWFTVHLTAMDKEELLRRYAARERNLAALDLSWLLDSLTVTNFA